MRNSTSLRREYKIKQWTVFALTFLSYASFHACRQSFANAKKSMQHDWHYNKHQEGTMDSIFLLSYALGLYGSGLLGDIFDAKKVHSFGLLSTAIILIIFASLHHVLSFPWLCIVWLLNGLFQSLGWPTAIKLVANWFNTDHDGAIFGTWAANQSIGNVIGALYVSVAHIRHWPTQWMFYLPAIQAILVSVLVYIFVQTNPPHINRPTRPNQDDLELLSNSQYSSHSPSDDVQMKHKMSFVQILKLKGVITYSLCHACLKAVNYSMFFWIPYFESNHFDATDGDYLEIAFNIAQVFGGFLCGYISDRSSKRTPIVMIFLLSAIIPIFFLHISNLPLSAVFILTFAAGFLIGGPANILNTVMGAEIAKDPMLKGNHSILSTVTGIIDGSGSLGAAVCQYAVVIVSDVSVELVFAMLALLLLLSGILLAPLCIRDTRKAYRENNRNNPRDENDGNEMIEMQENIQIM